jgi:hypothetical protein
MCTYFLYIAMMGFIFVLEPDCITTRSDMAVSTDI